MRIVWLATGYLFVAIGVIGLFLPVLPTTVFLLVAAACFARSSPRLHEWLISHPTLGPPIVNWQRHGAISRPAKRAAILSMTAVLTVSALVGLSRGVLAAQAGFMLVGAAFILTRPDGPKG